MIVKRKINNPVQYFKEKTKSFFFFQNINWICLRYLKLYRNRKIL